jgi:hypothetical protein
MNKGKWKVSGSILSWQKTAESMNIHKGNLKKPCPGSVISRIVIGAPLFLIISLLSAQANKWKDL